MPIVKEQYKQISRRILIAAGAAGLVLPITAAGGTVLAIMAQNCGNQLDRSATTPVVPQVPRKIVPEEEIHARKDFYTLVQTSYDQLLTEQEPLVDTSNHPGSWVQHSFEVPSKGMLGITGIVEIGKDSKADVSLRKSGEAYISHTKEAGHYTVIVQFEPIDNPERYKPKRVIFSLGVNTDVTLIRTQGLLPYKSTLNATGMKMYQKNISDFLNAGQK